MCLGFASVQELQVHGAWSSPFSAAEWKKNSTRCQWTEAAGVVATAARILAPHHARQLSAVCSSSYCCSQSSIGRGGESGGL
ncbi:unnamed protein product [Sphagnum troendelagicum]|uniref:Uncharacterized protein n=1 Tax=Sphagnum troendelagicum TaxID=128251 RepID=A0ABP0ULL5_9BRYO